MVVEVEETNVPRKQFTFTFRFGSFTVPSFFVHGWLDAVELGFGFCECFACFFFAIGVKQLS